MRIKSGTYVLWPALAFTLDVVSKPSVKISDLLLTIHIPWQSCNLYEYLISSSRFSARMAVGVARVKNIALPSERLTGCFYEDATAPRSYHHGPF